MIHGSHTPYGLVQEICFFIVNVYTFIYTYLMLLLQRLVLLFFPLLNLLCDGVCGKAIGDDDETECQRMVLVCIYTICMCSIIFPGPFTIASWIPLLLLHYILLFSKRMHSLTPHVRLYEGERTKTANKHILPMSHWRTSHLKVDCAACSIT